MPTLVDELEASCSEAPDRESNAPRGTKLLLRIIELSLTFAKSASYAWKGDQKKQSMSAY